MSSFFHDSINFISFYRDKAIPYSLSQLPPYIRKVERSFLHDSINKGAIRLFERFSFNKECISVLDTPHQIVVKMLVPYEILMEDKYTLKSVQYTKYYWQPNDFLQTVRPNGHKPFEAVSFVDAGIRHDYLESIAQNHLALHK